MWVFLLLQVFAAVQGGLVPGQVAICSRDSADEEIVRIQLYYETGCPFSIQAYIEDMAPLIKKIGSQLEVRTYPYGNARTTKTDSYQVLIKCQHGPEECYGNQLHACAIDVLKDTRQYVLFNACMMEYDTTVISNDEAADACGKKFNIDVEPIKSCAKGLLGFNLMLYYGIESQKIVYPGVPWWIVNDVIRDVHDGRSLTQTVCDAFKNPPKACADF